MPAAAAVAVLLLGVLTMVLLADDEPDATSPTPAPSASTSDGDGGAWRTETYRRVSVTVPGTWAVGGSPIDDGGSAGLVDCGVGPAEGAGQPATPYVGRPVRLDDRCDPLDPKSLPAPDAAYVWFGSPARPGKSGWDNGYTAETVAVGSQRVTVATDDAALRDQVVASVRGTDPSDDNGCPVVQPDVVRPAIMLSGDAQRLSVCVYERTVDQWEILWSGAQGAAEAQALLDAVDARTPERPTCETDTNAPRVLLYVHAERGGAGYIVDQSCDTLLVPDPDGRPGALLLDAELTEPWRLPGVATYSP